MKWWELILTLLLSGCDNPVDMGPPTSPIAPTTTSVAPGPPRVDAPFTWQYYHGFTAFASGEPSQSESDVRMLFAVAMAHGWQTARKCSETEFWSGTAALPIMPRDLERLKWWLEIVATIPGAKVLLIGDCTLKGPVPEQEGRNWARQVAALASQYENVAMETHNEYRNCAGRGWGPYCPTRGDVREHVKIYRDAGIQHVTADVGICKGDSRELFDLARVGAAPADFHACREVPLGSGRPWDPNKRFLRELVAVNGMVLLSETVAWTDNSGICDGLRTCDKQRIRDFIRVCAEVDQENGGMGCKYTLHSQDLLAGLPPTWWPEAR